jgi:UTP--glucose-1-phosphate uridylyltransferase
MKPRVRKAIFPVGGLGTRFLPATKAMPKEMLPVVDKPLIQYAVEEAWDAGIEQCIFITGRGKAAIEDHFDYSYELQHTLTARHKVDQLASCQQSIPNAGSFAFVRQQDPLGLGHAIWCARHLIGDEPFAVILADDVVMNPGGPSCMKQMVQAYENYAGSLVATVSVDKNATASYGILDVESDNGVLRARHVVEKPNPEDAPSTWAVIGRYILEPALFDPLDRAVRHAQTTQGEIQLTDAIAALLPESPLYGIKFDGVRYDCGSKVGFLQANIAFALAREDLAEPLKTFIRGLNL